MRVPFVRTTYSDRTAADRLPDRLAEGSKAGFVATLVMTAYRLPVSRSLPPTALFWSKFVSGGDPDDRPIAAVALHLLYGTVAGAVFGALVSLGATVGDADGHDGTRDATGDDPRETAASEALGLLWGTLFALALSVVGERVVLERVLGLDLDADERLVFHAGHLVYGLGLGTLFGSRTSDGR